MNKSKINQINNIVTAFTQYMNNKNNLILELFLFLFVLNTRGHF